ncbi:hypothetical protein HMPREF9599_02474 [Cutibacterium acnes HL050PA2]|nr:hypothetical protein HMPREF9599_02474 [Cutibacterium acnes HL050PA2]
MPRAVVSAVSWVHKAIFGKVGYACRREVRRSHRIVSPGGSVRPTQGD